MTVRSWCCTAISLYDFSIFGLGLPLIGFFANLLVMGWAIGLLVSGLVLRFGLAVFAHPSYSQYEIEDGYQSLFEGTDLSSWVIPEGDNGHWKVVDGVIDWCVCKFNVIHIPHNSI